MPSNLTILLVLLVVLVVCLPGNGVYAFGAGNIPSYAYMEGRAFRHGDIEDTLEKLIKAGGGLSLGSLIGKGGSKFGGLDIKRVYFGNWLRDYSQAMDIASLKKLQPQTIINLCMALGFLAHGYATHEFEVTEDRLGVYLPTEHIDNPKGYGDGEDARKYHPKLRPPVNPQELGIDPHTGMKNYIANENGTWDTSKALVRRTLEQCIHLGRQHRAQGRKQDEYEAYRLLGQALHTLEDFSAHSNFCELALVSMGYHNVFVHVGDQVRVHAQNGKMVAPLVTGTFGSSDFIHSLLGEATDHISEASVSDLNKELDKARTRSRGGPGSSGGGNPADMLRDLLFQLPSGAGGSEMTREMDSIERIRAGPAAGGKRPEDMSPQELHAVLWQVLTFRDSVVKKIEKTIEKIPGLGPLIEKLMDSISVFVFTTLEPYLKPIMKTATQGLMSASGEVIDTHDQYEVFNDPRASDPTHSFLSKDHFNLILNEPAGNLAKIVVQNTVELVVKAWDNTSVNVHQTTEQILECLFHPDFQNTNSKIQGQMTQYMRSWVQGLGHKQQEILHRLSKEQVRNHKNIRLAGEGGASAAQGTYAVNAAHNVQHQIGGYVNAIPGVHQAQGVMHSIGQFGQQTGFAREGTGPGGGSGSGYHPPPGPPPGSGAGSTPMPVSASGEAASFYGGTAGASSPAPPVRSDTRPGFPDAAPSGGPAFPSYGGGSASGGYNPNYSDTNANIPHAQHGYTPSYNSPPPGGPPGGPPPSFPNAPGASTYPGQHHGHTPPPPGGGGFGMPNPGGPPSFPSAGPAFPNAGAYAPPPFPPGQPDMGGSYYGGYQPPPGPPPGGW